MIDISICIYKFCNSKIIIKTKNELINYFKDSYNFYKTFKGFDLFLKSIDNLDDKFKVPSGNFFLDHKSYCNLFLTFNNKDDLLYYVQDTCEARGETIIKDFDQAISYLKHDETIVYTVEKFIISKSTWEEILNEYSKTKKIAS